jgi:hypothetical protein
VQARESCNPEIGTNAGKSINRRLARPPRVIVVAMVIDATAREAQN